MNFEIEAKWINEFKSMLDKDERVIRHLVMKQDNAITEECIPPPEFHTLRSDMDDDDDDDDDEYDEDEDDDGDDVESIDNGDEPGIIYVEDDSADHGNEKDRKPVGFGGRIKLEKSKK
ncbi:putative ribosomal protein S6 [Helianthus anomalus]